MTVLLFSIFSQSYASDADDSITCSSLMKFAGGIVAAFATHETAHAIVAELTDTNIEWGIGDYNQPIGFTEHATNDIDGLNLYSAGLVSQVVGSEIILRSGKIKKNDAFIRGMMAWNIINPILYSLDYWFFHRTNQKNGNSYQGDITGIEHYSNKETANLFAFSMVVISAFQGYRFLKTQKWAPNWVKGRSHTFNFNAITPSEGIGIKFEFHF